MTKMLSIVKQFQIHLAERNQRKIRNESKIHIWTTNISPKSIAFSNRSQLIKVIENLNLRFY